VSDPGRSQGSEHRNAAGSPGTGRYRFVKLGRFLFRAGRSALEVWGVLRRQHLEFLGSEGFTPDSRRRWVDRLPAPVLAWLRSVRVALRYPSERRRVAAGAGASVELPVDGDLAVVRRSGAVKVLDLRSRRVITVMQGSEAARKLRERLAATRAAASYAFAPPVLDEHPDWGWFAEEFIAGAHPVGFAGCSEGFSRVYLPLLVAFLRARAPMVRPVGAYAEELVARIRAPGSLWHRLPAGSRQNVDGFVERVREALRRSRDAESVPLVLSHGDLFSGNVLLPHGGGPPRAIDWAHLGDRSALFDLHYVLMNHCVKVLSPRQLHGRLEITVNALRKRLAAEDAVRFAEVDGGLHVRAAFRWLFYLECVLLPLEHCDDPADRYVGAMLQRVGWYQGHEAALASESLGASLARL